MTLFLQMLGRKIVAIEVYNDEKALRFTFDAGPCAVWSAWADPYRYSGTWFAEICGVDALLQHEVVQIRPLPSQPGVEIVTDGGRAQITLSCNGFYNGSIEDGNSRVYPGPWRNVTADWVAFP
jgi:hypothetical protein